MSNTPERAALEALQEALPLLVSHEANMRLSADSDALNRSHAVDVRRVIAQVEAALLAAGVGEAQPCKPLSEAQKIQSWTLRQLARHAQPSPEPRAEPAVGEVALKQITQEAVDAITGLGAGLRRPYHGRVWDIILAALRRVSASPASEQCSLEEGCLCSACARERAMTAGGELKLTRYGRLAYEAGRASTASAQQRPTRELLTRWSLRPGWNPGEHEMQVDVRDGAWLKLEDVEAEAKRTLTRLGDIHIMARRILARPEKGPKYLGYIVQWCEELGVKPASCLRDDAPAQDARCCRCAGVDKAIESCACRCHASAAVTDDPERPVTVDPIPGTTGYAVQRLKWPTKEPAQDAQTGSAQEDSAGLLHDRIAPASGRLRSAHPLADTRTQSPQEEA